MAPTPYTVERSTVVAAPADQIFPLLVDFHQWPRWSPWEDLDPDCSAPTAAPTPASARRTTGPATARPAPGRMEITDVADARRRWDRAAVPQAVQGRRTGSTFELGRAATAPDVTWRLTGDARPA